MAIPVTITQKTWNKKAWVQWLAVMIGILPYTIGFLFPQLTQPLNVKNTVLGTSIWAICIAVNLLLLRVINAETIRDLNINEGTWWKDLLTGAGLSALTLTILILYSETVSHLFPNQNRFVARLFFNEVFQNPWLFAFMIGPGILIAAGIGEELARVFVLTRLWKISDVKAWRWITIFLYALVVGLGHIYEGLSGVIGVAIVNLVLSFHYLRFGRFTVLMIAHYLNDVALFALLYITAHA